jgi:hypothetical protein
MTEAKFHGKLSIGRLCAATTSVVRRKYARSHSSASRLRNSSRAVDRLMLMMSKPSSIAWASPVINAPALPDFPSVSTLTELIDTRGATPRMIPAHAVPCPAESRGSHSSTRAARPSAVTTCHARSTGATSGCAPSTPLSSTHTRTPAPSAPCHAQPSSTWPNRLAGIGSSR